MSTTQQTTTTNNGNVKPQTPKQNIRTVSTPTIKQQTITKTTQKQQQRQQSTNTVVKRKINNTNNTNSNNNVVKIPQKSQQVQETELLQHIQNIETKFSQNTLPTSTQRVNVPEIINDLLGEDVSLTSVETLQAKLCQKVTNIDNELASKMKEQTEARDSGKENLKQTFTEIQELAQRFSHVRVLAEQSEEMVNQVSSRIKLKDLTKKNLSTTSVLYKRLVMLVRALKELNECISLKQYRSRSTICKKFC
eukprot:TRINITY_DN1701_c0_g3_i1.p1 TRINITY_DN1701_c0_g3~~TRINITY_DN1701_c0_g3_i1.p1  ORF type:complete len:250 (-),score=112.24 TRINITY_DN1701_c0_g3_i1:213-962(-)